MSVSTEVSTNRTLKDFLVSDGDPAKWPTNNTRILGQDSSFDYYEAVALNDPDSIRFRTQIAEKLQETSSWPNGLKYIMRDFPAGYRLFRHMKGTEQKHRADRYLYGSKNCPKFRSVAEFIPHAIWLFTQLSQLSPSTASSSSYSSPELNHDTCTCKYVKKKKTSPRKSQIHTGSDLICDSQSPVKKVESSAQPEEEAVIDGLSASLEDQARAGGKSQDMQVDSSLVVDDTAAEAAVAVVDDLSISFQGQTKEDKSEDDAVDSSDSLAVDDREKEASTAVVDGLSVSLQGKTKVEDKSKDREVGSPDSSLAIDDVTEGVMVAVVVEKATVDPSGSRSFAFGDKTENVPRTENAQNNLPVSLAIVSDAKTEKTGAGVVVVGERDIRSGASWSLSLAITDKPKEAEAVVNEKLETEESQGDPPRSSTYPTLPSLSPLIPLLTPSMGNTHLNVESPHLKRLVCPSHDTVSSNKLSFPISDGDSSLWPNSKAAQDRPLTTPNASPGTPKRKSNFQVIHSNHPLMTNWLEAVGRGVAKALKDKLGLDANMEYVFKDFPAGYQLFFSRRKAPNGKMGREDKYLFGSKFGRFRSPNEFIPHAIWLFESHLEALASPSLPSLSSSLSSQPQPQLQASSSSSRDQTADKIKPTPPTLDHSKCHCPYNQRQENQQNKKTNFLGTMRVIAGAVDYKAGSVPIQTVPTQLSVSGENLETQNVEADDKQKQSLGMKDRGKGKARARPRSCSPSSSARKKARMESPAGGMEVEEKVVMTDDKVDGRRVGPRKRRASGQSDAGVASLSKRPKEWDSSLNPNPVKASGRNIDSPPRPVLIQTKVDRKYPRVRTSRKNQDSTKWDIQKITGSVSATKSDSKKSDTLTTTVSTFLQNPTAATMPTSGSFTAPMASPAVLAAQQTTLPHDRPRPSSNWCFQLHEVVCFSLEKPIKGPRGDGEDDIKFWPVVIKGHGGDTYTIQLLGLPHTYPMTLVSQTDLLPYLACKVSPGLLQALSEEDLWDSTPFHSFLLQEYLISPFRLVARPYAIGLCLARRIAKSWGSGCVAVQPQVLAGHSLQMTAPIPIYYRQTPSFTSTDSAFPYLWWGPEHLSSSDLLRLKPSRLAFHRQTIPNVFAAFLPSGPGESIKATGGLELLGLNECASGLMSGAELRGVMLRVRQFFVEYVHDKKHTCAVRVCGMLYELTDTDWVPPISTTESVNFTDLPAPPKGYKFRPILPSHMEAVVSMDIVSGKYYGSSARNDTVDNSLNAVASVGLEDLEFLWALEGIVPGEGNAVFDQHETNVSWLGDEKTREELMKKTLNVDRNVVQSTFEQLKKKMAVS